MSDGRKAWAEEQEELAKQQYEARIAAVPLQKLTTDLKQLIHSIKAFQATQPSLTKMQWFYIGCIDDILEEYE